MIGAITIDVATDHTKTNYKKISYDPKEAKIVFEFSIFLSYLVKEFDFNGASKEINSLLVAKCFSKNNWLKISHYASKEYFKL